MKAIIVNDLKEYEALEALVYAGLVRDKIFIEDQKDEEDNVIQNFYSGRIKHADGRIAFRVEERVEKYLTRELLERATELSWDWHCPKNTIRGHKTPQYWLAYNDDLSVFHTGVTEVGQVTTSGQPNFERFDTEAELKARVNELKGKEYYRELQTPEVEGI